MQDSQTDLDASRPGATADVGYLFPEQVLRVATAATAYKRRCPQTDGQGRIGLVTALRDTVGNYIPSTKFRNKYYVEIAPAMAA